MCDPDKYPLFLCDVIFLQNEIFPHTDWFDEVAVRA
jgi:hypothetical protein